MAKQEKQTWFHTTLKNLESPLLGYVYQIIYRHETSEEIVQDGFLKLWNQEYPKFEDHYPKAWLFKVCRNMAIDYLRREKRISLDSDLEELLSTPCLNETLFDASVIMNEISKLPKRDQEVLLLKFGKELSYKDISQITGMSVNHVGNKLHHAINKIRLVVEKELEESSK
ncbi:sigma-70 family RNA polymerase sigma factor [Bacteriovoracaceae bacterium]|nr:sigma-70 family RNA polymerase sigma factor [Bacteriovoracaceae bacterium]